MTHSADITELYGPPDDSLDIELLDTHASLAETQALALRGQARLMGQMPIVSTRQQVNTMLSDFRFRLIVAAESLECVAAQFRNAAHMIYNRGADGGVDQSNQPDTPAVHEEHGDFAC